MPLTGSLTLENAVAAHASFVERLRNSVVGDASSFLPCQVADESFCPLGRRLAVSKLPDRFLDLIRKAHMLVHQEASCVALLAASGARAEAIARFEGNFIKASEELVGALLGQRLRLTV